MFTKILIANRGEIAVRIIRACREMEISPVAVYSEADRAALHVRLADEAYLLGPAPSTQSYLAFEKIIEIAHRCGAQAIHPGYGFLSENAEFARAVEDAGLMLIGPPWQAMQLMGSKTSARQAALRAGAPIVPGTAEPLAGEKDACRVAEEIGFPVMLKASAGGGGKGMRLIKTGDELKSAYALAQAEAASAFKDPSLYLEKAIANPRHIEIQILADRYGNTVYLGERECSIQRRHQKVIEECPSPLNDADLRRRAGEAAVRIARAAGYYNAGTIEFLVDSDRNFYFLEMNTRLQVEHPVTEMVTGIDLVKEQIRIAAGEMLSFTQDEIQMRGAAIECRIYAEDPDNNFLPAPGCIVKYKEPTGPGVRVDGGSYEGWQVPIYYDPLLSKLITWGRTRQEAIARMRRALDEYVIDGIRTTIPFFKEVLTAKSFLSGEIDTGFIDRFLEDKRARGLRGRRRDAGREAVSPHLSSIDAAVIAAVVHYSSQTSLLQKDAAITSPQSQWKMSGRAAFNNRLYNNLSGC